MTVTPEHNIWNKLEFREDSPNNNVYGWTFVEFPNIYITDAEYSVVQQEIAAHWRVNSGGETNEMHDELYDALVDRYIIAGPTPEDPFVENFTEEY